MTFLSRAVSLSHLLPLCYTLFLYHYLVFVFFFNSHFRLLTTFLYKQTVFASSHFGFGCPTLVLNDDIRYNSIDCLISLSLS